MSEPDESAFAAASSSADNVPVVSPTEPDRQEPGADEPADRQCHRGQAARRFPLVKRAAAVLVVLVGAAAGLAGLRWALFEWIDWGMSPHTYESAEDATSLAEGIGLALVDGDDVVYGEVFSAFPDSSAYLVIVTPSADRLVQLLDRSGFPPPTPITQDHFDVRSRDNHGPVPSSTLVRSTRWQSTNYLTATWDPVQNPRTIYLTATQT